MKIECYADEKQIIINGMINMMCPFSCGGEYCHNGEDGCRKCLENRIEWKIQEEKEDE